MERLQKTSFVELAERYSLFLFDAYGVLVNGAGTIEHAKSALEYLCDNDVPFFIISNDASVSRKQTLEKYQKYAFPVSSDNILTSGMLLQEYLERHANREKKVMLMGPESVHSYVTEAGSQIVPFHANETPDIVALMDTDSVLSLEDSLNVLITIIQRTAHTDSLPTFILANPDLLYPKSQHSFACAVGSVACALEAVLALHYVGVEAPRFIKLGKPYTPIFEKALEKHPDRQGVMIGDQLATDVRGAKNVGIHSAIVLTGMSQEKDIRGAPPESAPTYILESLKI